MYSEHQITCNEHTTMYSVQCTSDDCLLRLCWKGRQEIIFVSKKPATGSSPQFHTQIAVADEEIKAFLNILKSKDHNLDNLIYTVDLKSSDLY